MSDKGSPSAEITALAPADCPAVILAGGQSSRFGSDKALVDLSGRPLLLALRETLLRQGHEVDVVANRADRYQHLGINCLVDHVDNSGPMSGLATGLTHRLRREAGWMLLLSCDQVCWRHEWFTALAKEVVHANQTSRCDAAYFVSLVPSGRQHMEPFPSLLHTRILPEVLQRLQMRELSLQKLLADLCAVGVRAHSSPKQWSFNTPQELEHIRAARYLT